MPLSKISFPLKYQKFIFILVCLLPTVLILYSIFNEGIPGGHDYNAHMLRLISLKNEMGNNQFPYVFDYWSQFNVGFSWNIFYPPLTTINFFISAYFFPFLDTYGQMKLAITQIIVINFICSFYAGKRQYDSILAGLLCTAILSSTYYYLTILNLRFAISELASIGFIILFIRGLSSLITDKKDKYLIPICAPLILLASIPMAVATFYFSLLFFFIYYKKLIKLNLIFFLIKSVIICILISSIYLLPLYYNIHGNYIYMSSNALFSYKEFTGTSLKSLLWGTSFAPLSVGLIYNLEALRQTIINWKQNKKIFFLVICLLISCSTLFPWWIVPDQFTLFNIMQFSWRLLSIIICVMALWLAGTILQQHGYIYCSCIILLTLLFNPLNSDEIMILKDRPLKIDLVYKDYSNNHMLKNIYTSFHEPLKEDPFKALRTHNITSKINQGFPIYTLETKESGIISLPIIYYNSVTTIINGEEKTPIYMEDGSVGVPITKGVNTIAIGYNYQYNLYGIGLLLLGVLLLLLDIFIHTLFSKKRKAYK